MRDPFKDSLKIVDKFKLILSKIILSVLLAAITLPMTAQCADTETEVQPTLTQRFINCFGFKEEGKWQPKAGFDLTKWAGILKTTSRHEWFLTNAPAGSSALVTVFEEFVGRSTLTPKETQLLDFLKDFCDNYAAYLLIYRPLPALEQQFEKETDKFTKGMINDRVYRARQELIRLFPQITRFLGDPLRFAEACEMPPELLYKSLFSLEKYGVLSKFFREKKFDFPDRLEREALALRKENTKEAIFNYAIMLITEETNIAFDGVARLEAEVDLNKEIADLLRLSGIPIAKLHYAELIHRRKVENLAFDGITVLSTPIERNAERARLLRESGKGAMYSIAEMLTDGETDISFDGRRRLTTPEQRNKEAARLYQLVRTSEARTHFAGMLVLGQISFSFEKNKPLKNQQEREHEAKQILKNIDIPTAQYNYVSLLLVDPTLEACDQALLLLDKDHAGREPSFENDIRIKRIIVEMKRYDIEIKQYETLSRQPKQSYITQLQEACETSMADGSEEAETLYDAVTAIQEEADETTAAGLDLSATAAPTSFAAASAPPHEPLPTEVCDLKESFSKPVPQITKGDAYKRRVEKIIDDYVRTNMTPKQRKIYTVRWECDRTFPQGVNEQAVNEKIESILRGENRGHLKALKGSGPKFEESVKGIKLFSSRITDEHRLVFSYDHKNEELVIWRAHGHYGRRAQ